MSNLAIKLETIQFHNQSLIALNHQNKPYIAMKPICENIGLNWAAQFKRIQRHHVLNKGVVMMTIPSKSGEQQYLCLPLSIINGWLFGIETSRVKPEIRLMLEQYQLECFDVLYNHFMPKVAQQYPNTISIEQQQMIKRAVQERSFRTSEHYQAIYTKLYEHFKIPRYQDLPAAKFDNAIKFLGGVSTKPTCLTGDELCDFAWLYKAAEQMRSELEEIEPAFRILKSEKATKYYTISRESRHIIQRCKKLVQEKMQTTQIDRNTIDWQRVLPFIQ